MTRELTPLFALAKVVRWRGCGSRGSQAVIGSARLLKCRPRHSCVIRKVFRDDADSYVNSGSVL